MEKIAPKKQFKSLLLACAITSMAVYPLMASRRLSCERTKKKYLLSKGAQCPDIQIGYHFMINNQFDGPTAVRVSVKLISCKRNFPLVSDRNVRKSSLLISCLRKA